MKTSCCRTVSTQGFPWFTGSYWPIRFDFTTVPYGDSGRSLETIVTPNLIGQNKHIVQRKCFIQLGAECCSGILVSWHVSSSGDGSAAVVMTRANGRLKVQTGWWQRSTRLSDKKVKLKMPMAFGFLLTFWPFLFLKWSMPVSVNILHQEKKNG